MFFAGCQKEENAFSLEVDIHGFTDTTAILYGVFNQPDSLMRFSMKDGKLKCVVPMDTLTPVCLLLGDGYQHQTKTVLFADKGTAIRIEGDASHLNDLKITGGGEEQSLYQSFLNQWHSGNITKGIKEVADSFIVSHPLSVVSVFLIKEYFVQAPDIAKEEINRVVNQLGGKMQDHPYILRLHDEIGDLKEIQVNRNYYFTSVPDTLGREITQKEMKDHYVVLTFWASWHEKSREMLDSLRNVITLFEKGPVNFVHFSLDSNREDWMEVVRADSVPGIHVCSFLGWSDPTVVTTGVTDIPYSVLISPKGRILGIDMRRDILEELLKAQLKLSKQ